MKRISVIYILINFLSGLILGYMGLFFDEIVYWIITLPIVFISFLFSDFFIKLEDRAYDYFSGKRYDIDKDKIINDWKNLQK